VISARLAPALGSLRIDEITPPAPWTMAGRSA